MKEKEGKRREWVKTAAIVFLSIMLVLTFFSNTIMNYSLPEVATQYVQAGTITAKVRCDGIVESGSLYNVKVSESRKVTGINVRVGDKVQIGDVLCSLDEKESDELAAAMEELNAAQEAYELALLAGNLTVSQMQNAGKTQSLDTYRKQLIAAQSEVDAAKQEIQNYTPAYDAVKQGYDDAKKALDDANNKLNTVQSWMDYKMSITSGNASSLEKQYNEAKQIAINAQNVYNTRAAEFAVAEETMQKLQDTVTKKEQVVSDLAADIGTELNLGSLYENVTKAQKKIDKLKEQSMGTEITAEIAGTITQVNVTAGENTSPDMPVFVIQPEGKGYTLSAQVPQERVKNISVGDPGELVNSWWYNDITATVASIKPNPQDRNTKIVTFNLSGELTEGQSLSLQVGQKSANYDFVVPNSAIREDNNGKFILVVEPKSSPLGTRYYAVRYDVEVLASDDTKSAVNGALYGYEYVITTATKPVEAGKLVRLPD